MLVALRIFIGVVVLLWATDIGPEEYLPDPERPKGNAGRGNKNSPPLKQLKFVSRNLSPVEREAFLRAFERQASIELLPCLVRWKPSPMEILISARLQRKSGKLVHPLLVDTALQLPECASAAMEAMDFLHISKHLKIDAADIQWRVDW